MRKLILLATIFCCLSANCQTKQTTAKTTTQTKTTASSSFVPKYAIYPTENIKILIKLNTATGQMWLVQYSTDSRSDALQADLNTKVLASDGGKKNGRFVLQPTKNMFNFILLDQIDGGVWQVQWSVDPQNRLVFKIE